MDAGRLLFLALEDGRSFAGEVARALGRPLAGLDEREFEDGESRARPGESVRGRDVYVLQSLHGDRRRSAGEKLLRLLFLVGTLRDAGAASITAVAPYLCYARMDRRKDPRDPLATRYVAQFFEAAGADRVVTVDVHDVAAFENAFRIGAENLEAQGLLVAAVRGVLAPGEEPVVVSPDAGGIQRAAAFRGELARTLGLEDLPGAILEKERTDRGVSGPPLAADLDGRTAILVDDMVSSGSTLARAAQACLDRGARRVLAAATHGVFGEKSAEILTAAPIERLVIADTIPPGDRLPEAYVRDRLTVVPAAPLVAAAIRRLHEGEEPA